jgi:hypothetical protein
MFVLDWLRDVTGFGGFQGSPYPASETPGTTRHETDYGVPYWVVPNDLLCVFTRNERMFYRYHPCLFGRYEFNKAACRLRLVIDMLDFADDHGGGFGVKAIYREFAHDISLHDVMALARNLERVGILERPPQRNRPRRLNRDVYDSWWDAAIDWLDSDPEGISVYTE